MADGDEKDLPGALCENVVGSLLSVTGTGVHPLQYMYGIDSDGPYTVEIKVTGSGGTNEWVKTSSDMLGRAYKTTYAASSTPYPFALSTWNTKGQLTNQVDPDGVINLFAYSPKGEQTYSVLDSNRNYTIDYSGLDQITFTTNDVITDHGTTVRRTQTFVWSTQNSNSSNLVSTVETSADGLQSWQTQYRDASTAVTSQGRTVYAGSGNRYQTNIAPDGSFAVSAYQNGLLLSATRKDSGGNQLTSTTFGYDAHGRQNTVTDARNGTTTSTFNSADLVVSVTTPNPGTLGGSAQTAYTYYNPMLQATNILQPDGTSTSTAYLLTGEVSTNWGSRTYPVAYTYDYGGRMATLTTWTGFASGSGAATTTWNYDQYRGWLNSKTYTGSVAGPSYTYTSAGRLKTRVWARSVTTTYSYDYAGRLFAISYSDSTPAVTNTFDRLSRTASVVCNGMTDTMAYNTANQLLSETYSGGTLAGLAVTNGFDQYLRRTNLAALNSPTPLVKQTFGYDNASRLASVTDNSGAIPYSATYSYLANSPLVSQIVFKTNTTTRMTTTKSYDFLNRLTSISSVPSGASTVSFAYTYNSANQRVRVAMADGSYWLYIYDQLGQVISGHKFWSDGSPVAGQQFDYGFDTIGNRTSTLAGGDQNGLNQRSASYTANALNQYTQRTVPGDVDIMGISYATNTVTVNGNTAYRKVEYFRDQLPVNNGSAALWTNIIVAATGQTSVTGNVFVAQSPENFGYDADGNMTNDGRWVFTWDGENRLVSLQGLGGIPTGAKFKLDLVYDPQGRRIQKLVSTNNGSAYYPLSTNRFLYDGWNLLAIVNPQSALVQSFAWGLDLNGGSKAAGQVGGLLEISDVINGVHFPAFDGSGNVGGLFKAADGSNSATYEFGPFGEALRTTGLMAKVSPLRFSTKVEDDETDLLYYGLRYCNSSSGRWLNQDPVAENGGMNVYGFVDNRPTGRTDSLGAKGCDVCGENITDALKLTLDNIISTYSGWSREQRLSACKTITGQTERPVEDSFDILELAYFTEQFQRAIPKYHQPFVGGTGRCRYALTFKGKCYYARSINYASWGVMNSLCYKDFPGQFGTVPIVIVIIGPPPIVISRSYTFEYYTESTAVQIARVWKWVHWREPPWSDVTRQAVEFTKYGYRYVLGQDYSPGSESNCSASGRQFPKRLFHWCWLPIKPREQLPGVQAP